MKSLIYSILLVVPLTSMAATAHSQAKAAAEPAVTAWLVLTDHGQSDASWDAAAALFQSAVTKEEWRRSLKAVRTPLGTVLSREVASSEYRTELPGAPDGEYVIYTFNASFDNKSRAVETVTAMRGMDGNWRVAGYFIK